MAICAFAIVRKENKILLVRIAPPFAEAQKWNFPGGVIEENENIKEGLIREVIEETDIECRIGKAVDSFNTTDPDNEINIFHATYTQGVISVQEEEITEARWFTKDEALKLALAFNIRSYVDDINQIAE